jgi:hypothetical protein
LIIPPPESVPDAIFGVVSPDSKNLVCSLPVSPLPARERVGVRGRLAASTLAHTGEKLRGIYHPSSTSRDVRIPMLPRKDRAIGHESA